MSSTYKIPSETAEHTLEVKKSRFITRLFPLENKDSMKQALARAKQDFPDARHHCWAYVLGPAKQPVAMASNDDGEPSGTAGKPMLNVLSHKDIGDIGAIVIRYFGGIKLGAGGLVRAYSQAVQQAVERLPLIEKKSLTEVYIKTAYSMESQVRYWLKDAEILSTHYDGGFRLSANVDEDVLTNLQHKVAHLPGSSIETKKDG